jgi:hypothetical protein
MKKVVLRNKNGQRLCKHNRTLYYCKYCNGKGICEHNRQRAACKDCGGSQICEHDRRREWCKECGGSAFCKHRRQRLRCKECGGFPVLAEQMFYNAKRRAKKYNLSFTVTVEDILEMIGDGICPVFNIYYNLSSNRIVFDSAALDRFIPSIGYSKENCFVISNLANRIKTDATAEQVGLVAKWMKNTQERKQCAR